MSVVEKLFASDWGQVRVGSKSYSVRLLVTIAGATLWLGTMLVETGTSGIISSWTVLVYLGPLLAICSATRTVTFRHLISLFFIGGFMMGVALLVIDAVMPNTSVRDFLVPPFEESCKIAPVLFLLWRWRKSRLWTLAVTDVLLMAAFCGAGFGIVEDAYIRHHMAWPNQLSWLPITAFSEGRMDSGHAIWTTLAGATIGLALLIRGRRRLAIALGASGFVISILDHITGNYAVGSHIQLVFSFLNAITVSGYLALWMFFLGTLLAVAADLYIAHLALPNLPELEMPKNFQAKWMFVVQKRALAHAVFHYRHSSGLQKAEAVCTAALLDAWFQNVRFAYEQVPSSVRAST